MTSSLGWQLLERYRRIKRSILRLGGAPRRRYELWTGKLQRRLEPPPVMPTAPVNHRAILQSDPQEERAPRFPPPAEWLGAPRRPPVVIVIPHLNRLATLRKCLASIRSATRYPRYWVCVFDQGSTDGSAEYLDAQADVTAILAPRNFGFAKATNLALDRFPGWDPVLLNNDTEVGEGWLETLVETATCAESIGMVGAKLVYPDGRLQEAGSEIYRDGSARALGKFEDAGDPRFNQRREVDYCSAACLYIKRAVFDDAGGLAEDYEPAYYEDADLAFRVRRAGYKIVYEPESRVIHEEYGSIGKETALEWMEQNRKLFAERWRSELAVFPRSLWELAPRPASQDPRHR